MNTQISSIVHTAPILNVAQLHAGSAINIIPEHGKMRLGLRPMPGHDHTILIGNLKDRLQDVQLAASEAGALIELNIIQIAAPLYTLPTLLEQSIQQTCPNTPCLGAPFATDGGCLCRNGDSTTHLDQEVLMLHISPMSMLKLEELNQYEHSLEESILRTWCL